MGSTVFVSIILGWLADKWGHKVLIMKVCASLVVIFNVWEAYAIANEIEWMFVSGAVILTCLTTAIANLVGVVIAELTWEGQHRLRALKWTYIFGNIAGFFAPMTQYFVLKYLRKQHWSVQDLQPVLLSGTLFTIPFMICTCMMKAERIYEGVL